MVRYSLAFSEFALAALLSQKGRDRRLLMQKLVHLREFPESVAEFSTPGPRGRTIDGCRMGKFTIDYWIDHAEEEVKIVNIERTTRNF